MIHAQDIIGKIASGDVSPVYLLIGKEKFFHDQVIQAMTQHLLPDASSRSLNLYLLYGGENSLPEVVNAAQSRPMLADKKLVIVRDFNRMRAGDSEPFIKYLENPQPYTVLVMAAEELGAGNVNKAARKQAVEVECKPLSEHKVASWIRSRAKGKQVPLDESACEALGGLTGNNLLTIDHELEKLANFMAGADTISADDVARLSGLSAEYNVFNLQRTLSLRDIKKSYVIIKRLIEAGDNIHMIMAVLFAHFRKTLLVSRMLEKNESPAAIKQALKMGDYQLRQIMQTKQKFSVDAIENVISFLQSLDKELKSSSLKDEYAAQSLCYNICTA